MSLGLKKIIRAKIDQDTIREILQKKGDIQSLLTRGLKFTESPVSASSRSTTVRVLAVTEEQQAQLTEVALKYFHEDIEKAAGWAIQIGLEYRRNEMPHRRTPSPVNKREQHGPLESAPERELLIQYRTALGMSQRQLATHINMSRSLLGDIERGRPSHSSAALRNRLFYAIKDVAEKLGVSLE